LQPRDRSRGVSRASGAPGYVLAKLARDLTKNEKIEEVNFYARQLSK